MTATMPWSERDRIDRMTGATRRTAVLTGRPLDHWLRSRGRSESDIRTTLMTVGRQHAPAMSCDVPWIAATETVAD